MELNNETPNSAVIDAVMSDDKNKDEAVKAAIQRDAEIDKRNAGILAAAMSSMFPVLDFSKYGFLKGLAKVGIETATGAAGGYLGNRGGKYLDDKLGTSFLQGIGSFAGGLAGYGLGNRAYTAYSLTRPLKLRTDYIKQNIVSNQNTINPRYFDSNGFNAENIATDYASGRQSAINFLGSEIKRNSDKHNAELAKRIGYKHFDPNVTAEVRAATPMQERTNSDAI